VRSGPLYIPAFQIPIYALRFRYADKDEKIPHDEATVCAANGGWTQPERKLDALKLYRDRTYEVTLGLKTLGPYNYSATVTMQCSQGGENESYW